MVVVVVVVVVVAVVEVVVEPASVDAVVDAAGVGWTAVAECTAAVTAGRCCGMDLPQQQLTCE